MSTEKEAERLHATVLVAPAKERRRLRKQRRAAAAELAVEQRRGAMSEAKAKKARTTPTLRYSPTIAVCWRRRDLIRI